MKLYPRPERQAPGLPGRPFRDSAIFYAVLAVVIVVLGLVTGGGIVRPLAYAGGFFVLATAWTWWRFRTRLKRGERP